MPTSTNPVYDIKYSHDLFPNIPENEAEVARRVMDAYKRVGAIMSWNCTPHLAENIPLFGETVAFSESSATPYVNPVIGACTNREAAQSALVAEVIGKTPNHGLHIGENRKGTHLVDVAATLNDEFDYALLGQYVGKVVGYGIPVLTGITRHPTTEEFINFCTMSNTSGAISMFYMPGLTVETSTVKEAFQGDMPKDKVTVTSKELREIQEELQTTSGNIDFVQLGCPHYTLNQIAEVAALLENKKLHKDISF